ncbi:unnamed protein product [Nippostrongylus brasiliensis]|uniref:DNA topoisomerase n=1 Tax=Nippostrongylus brasiliensis TaxID=27835 RepID=A0A0N4Y777_NIPBR|nr:unnamed protein product [Nippostrongylus brasiliensis]
MVRREGRSVYNKLYELTAELLGQVLFLSSVFVDVRNQLSITSQQSTLLVTSVSGHLMEQCFGPEMKNWMTVPIGSLFDAPVYTVVPESMNNIARTLIEQSKKCDVLVIWTDCDREGESIGAEIAKVCLESNRRMDVYRAKLDQNTVDAVECRSELDLRIGAAFTRLQTLHLQQKFSSLLCTDGMRSFLSGGKQVVSYGSCQFPTLGFVVDRYKSIENFVSEMFWKLSVEHNREGKKVCCFMFSYNPPPKSVVY